MLIPAPKNKRKRVMQHVCLMCGHTAKCRAYLLRHQLTHSDVKPHMCAECRVCFKTVSDLNAHKRLHMGQKYICEHCGFTCKQAKILRRHMLVHDEKRLQCPECHYTARRKEDLRKHIISMHRGKPRRKRHEEAVATLLTNLHIPFTREHVVKFASVHPGRRFARIDFFWLCVDTAILFEVDEYAHMGCRYGVESECIRMWGIYEELRNKGYDKVHIVRYNPHAPRGEQYTDDERLRQISEALAYVPAACLVITYLFYHMQGNLPSIAFSEEYTLKNYVRSRDPVQVQCAPSLPMINCAHLF